MLRNSSVQQEGQNQKAQVVISPDKVDQGEPTYQLGPQSIHTITNSTILLTKNQTSRQKTLSDPQNIKVDQKKSSILINLNSFVHSIQERQTFKNSDIYNVIKQMNYDKIRFVLCGQFSNQLLQEIKKVTVFSNIETKPQYIHESLLKAEWQIFNIYLISSYLFNQNEVQDIYRKTKHVFYLNKYYQTKNIDKIKTQHQPINNVQNLFISSCNRNSTQYNSQRSLIKSIYNSVINLSCLDKHFLMHPNFYFSFDESNQLEISHLNLLWLLKSPINQSAYKQFFVQYLVIHNEVSKIDQYEFSIQQLIQQISNGDLEKNFQCIRRYTVQSFFYQIINNSLRVLRDPFQTSYFKYPIYLLNHQIKQLFYIQIAQGKYQDQQILFRGCHFTQLQVKNLKKKVGKFLQFQGFMSTSSDQITARKFGPHLMVIKIPKFSCKNPQVNAEFGTFAEIQQFSVYSQQKQILFTPLNFFKLISIQVQTDSSLIIYLEYTYILNKQQTVKYHDDVLLERNISRLYFLSRHIRNQKSLFHFLGRHEEHLEISLRVLDNIIFQNQKKLLPVQYKEIMSWIYQSFMMELMKQQSPFNIVIQIISRMFIRKCPSLQLSLLILTLEIQEIYIKDCILSSLYYMLHQKNRLSISIMVKKSQILIYLSAKKYIDKLSHDMRNSLVKVLDDKIAQLKELQTLQLFKYSLSIFSPLIQNVTSHRQGRDIVQKVNIIQTREYDLIFKRQKLITLMKLAQNKIFQGPSYNKQVKKLSQPTYYWSLEAFMHNFLLYNFQNYLQINISEAIYFQIKQQGITISGYDQYYQIINSLSFKKCECFKNQNFHYSSFIQNMYDCDQFNSCNENIKNPIYQRIINVINFFIKYLLDKISELQKSNMLCLQCFLKEIESQINAFILRFIITQMTGLLQFMQDLMYLRGGFICYKAIQMRKNNLNAIMNNQSPIQLLEILKFSSQFNLWLLKMLTEMLNFHKQESKQQKKSGKISCVTLYQRTNMIQNLSQMILGNPLINNRNKIVILNRKRLQFDRQVCKKTLFQLKLRNIMSINKSQISKKLTKKFREKMYRI